MHKETQEDRVVAILSDRMPHCGTEFLAAYMPRYSAVIFTLRKRGFVIEGEHCRIHPGRTAHNVFQFTLRHNPNVAVHKEQVALFPTLVKTASQAGH